MLAAVAVVMTGMGVVVAAIAGRSEVGARFAPMLPAPVRDFFNRPSNVQPVHVRDAIGSSVGRIAPAPVRPGTRTAAETFSIGSTEAEVLRIQGRPTRVDGSTWHYGESEIRFVAGHVVSWNSSVRNPLNAR